MPLDKADLDAISGVVNTAVEARFGALKTGLETRLGKIETTVTKLEEGADDDKKDKDAADDKKDKEDKTEMRAELHKTVLAAVREVLPKATIENLNSLSAVNAGGKDEYAEKLQLCEAAGVTGARAIRHIANKWPAIYTAKFGNGGGQKGSAKTQL